MGTSVNQPSPGTIPWMAVAAAYRDDDVPIDRVLREVWRAARSEPDADVRDLLSSSGVLVCLQVATEFESPASVSSHVVAELASNRAGSVASEIAKRAAVLSTRHESRHAGFVIHLFEQMTDYLVSRDLPGYIGERWRNKTVGEATKFKDALRRRTADLVGSVDIPERMAQAQTWRSIVDSVVEHLAGRI